MAVLKAALVLLMASCVYAEVLIKRTCIPGPGIASQQHCSKQIIQDLLRDYSGGIPDLGVKALDPIYLDQIEIAEDSVNTKSVFPSLRVTGFKNVIIDDIREDNETDAVTYLMKFDFVAEGPVSIEMPRKKKAFVGDVRYEGGASAAIIHTYSSKTVHTRSEVKTLYEAGPELIACESLHVKSKLNEELTDSLHEDSDVQAHLEQWGKIQKDHQAKVVCAIAEEVFKAAMSNIRAFSRLNWR